jgi:RNA polymerase sigma-70 factor (ECF subfamily)
MQPEARSLIDRFLGGDPETYRLVDGWIQRAASPFRRRLGDHWEDALQAARTEITRLLQRNAFRGEASLSTYIWRIVNHVCIDQLRAAQRTAWIDIDAIEPPAAKAEGSPLAAVLRKETAEGLLRVLEGVPAECRRMWSMIMAGKSYGEMSTELGASEGALRVRVLRCRKQALAMRARAMDEEGTRA